jgi:hypothetical protein
MPRRARKSLRENVLPRRHLELFEKRAGRHDE